MRPRAWKYCLQTRQHLQTFHRFNHRRHRQTSGVLRCLGLDTQKTQVSESTVSRGCLTMRQHLRLPISACMPTSTINMSFIFHCALQCDMQYMLRYFLNFVVVAITEMFSVELRSCRPWCQGQLFTSSRASASEAELWHNYLPAEPSSEVSCLVLGCKYWILCIMHYVFCSNLLLSE